MPHTPQVGAYRYKLASQCCACKQQPPRSPLPLPLRAAASLGNCSALTGPSGSRLGERAPAPLQAFTLAARLSATRLDYAPARWNGHPNQAQSLPIPARGLACLAGLGLLARWLVLASWSYLVAGPGWSLLARQFQPGPARTTSQDHPASARKSAPACPREYDRRMLRMKYGHNKMPAPVRPQV
jgi:hypothetical protein